MVSSTMFRLLRSSFVVAMISVSPGAHAQTRGGPPAIPYAQDWGPTTYSRIGSTTFRSDGSKAKRIGDST
ncbi:MAG: hypothetical protein JWM91_3448 [Rhodospirillales bacterium]|nr:hypothetical protein [Rhodospirillales bacterium]